MQEMTQAEYARHRGVSRVAIHKAIGAGKIPFREENGKKLIDPAAADLALGVNVQRAIAEDEPEERERVQPAGLTAARTANEVFKARLAELAYAKELGKVRPVEDFTVATQICCEVMLRAIKIAKRSDEVNAAATRGGVIGVRDVLRQIERDLRTVVADAFTKLAADDLDVDDAADEDEAE